MAHLCPLALAGRVCTPKAGDLFLILIHPFHRLTRSPPGPLASRTLGHLALAFSVTTSAAWLSTPAAVAAVAAALAAAVAASVAACVACEDDEVRPSRIRRSE